MVPLFKFKSEPNKKSISKFFIGTLEPHLHPKENAGVMLFAIKQNDGYMMYATNNSSLATERKSIAYARYPCKRPVDVHFNDNQTMKELQESAIRKIHKVLNEAGSVDQKIYNRLLKAITDEFDYIDPTQSKPIAAELIMWLQRYVKS